MILVQGIFVKSRNILKRFMKNLNMLFNNKLPTDLYTTFQIIKLFIKKGNLNLIHNKITYQISWIHAIKNNIKRNIHINIRNIKFHQLKHHLHINIPIYKKEENLIHDFILHTRNFLHEMENKYCIMGSINQDKQ